MKRLYLVKVEGRYYHTKYTPEQTAMIQRLQSAGMSLDAIAEATGVGYSSLSYVGGMVHLSKVLAQEEVD